MIRQPVFAGHFYPADADLLRRDVESHILASRPTGGGRRPALALVVPHAGYIYSGSVAGATYAAAELPAVLLILCPNHTGAGRPIAAMSSGAWATPLGEVPVDEALAGRLLETCAGLEVDARAHAREHSLEVQLPFLQVALGAFTFVPVCVGTGKLDALLDLGRGIARAIAESERRIGIVVSSDMSHYVPADVARARDQAAIERMVAVDPEGLHREVRERDISMCGYAPAVAGLEAARRGGAASGRLIAYASSGDTTGDYDSVVGYAGLVFS
jgi:hypothetical protein